MRALLLGLFMTGSVAHANDDQLRELAFGVDLTQLFAAMLQPCRKTMAASSFFMASRSPSASSNRWP